MPTKDTHRKINKKLLATQKATEAFIASVEEEIVKTSNKKMVSLLKEHHQLVNTHFSALFDQMKKLQEETQQEVYQNSMRLLDEIEQLKRTNNTVISENFLLEYKRKNLLILANNLEEAYVEISAKNRELQEQKQHISNQANRIKKANEEILQKNEELEQQKESILDQADYLHEANQTIISMHEKVQKQKNEILKKNEELISLNNEKNNLIGIVAHDLKSPLNQIKGLISVIKIKADQIDDETRHYIDIIEGSATRLNEMINKILDIEAIEAKKLNLRLENTNLSHILEECIERFELTAQEKGIKLVKDIEPNLIAKIDSDYINQIYDNLVSNAIKFSPRQVQVSVCLLKEKDQVMCCVKDEGPGLSEEDMKKLFGKYQKLSAKPTGNETSTGLGLSIVKKFVVAMNGKIWCESKEGEGASFYVTFKLAEE